MIVCLVCAGLLCASPPRATADDDLPSRARAMAGNGQRPEAIRLLREHLGAVPADHDARVLLGLVLSWEGQYDEARTTLRLVLEQDPGHGDALPALMNVEIWDGHPERADAMAVSLTAPGARVSAPIFLGRARALAAMHRTAEARELVRRVLRSRTSNEEALRLLDVFDADLRRWEAQSGYTSDWFSDSSREAWHEAWVSLKRETRVGAVIGRISRAERFGLVDGLFEIDVYPRFRPGTYAYVNVGVAGNDRLYPDYRAGVDLYQSLGNGFEASAGFRRLQFSEPVTIYVGSVSKYHGDWLFTGRTYVTPDTLGPSVSLHGIARRYFGAGGTDYVGFRYSHGRSKEEIQSLDDLALLHADALAGELDTRMAGRLGVNLQGSFSRKERAAREAMRHYSFSATIGWRF
jgi:YaiO family outer membrane protein